MNHAPRIKEEVLCKLGKILGRCALVWMGEEVDTFECGYWSINSDQATELCQLPTPPSSKTGKIVYYMFRFYRAAELVFNLRYKPFPDKARIAEQEAVMMDAWNALPDSHLKTLVYDMVYKN